MNVIFDTLNLYYLPQYLPVYNELIRKGHQCVFLCYRNKNDETQFSEALAALNTPLHWVDNEQDALAYFLDKQPDWIFFGNAFDHLDQVHQFSKTVQLGHGIGPKPSYYHKSRTPMTVRFIEGTLRLAKIKSLYPDDNFVQVGFSKLDPLFTGEEEGIDFDALGLDSKKKTILYAPTFNPSSLECFPNDWPSDFNEFNIVIKPHTFTYTRAQYKNQRKKLEKWSAFKNCHVTPKTELSLLPYIKSADIMISEASSTLFEFIASGKPVVVCDFYKLKWSYKGIFKYRFKARFGVDNVLYESIGQHVSSYSLLKEAVDRQLLYPEEFEQERLRYVADHVGPVDGKASIRIVDYLEKVQL